MLSYKFIMLFYIIFCKNLIIENMKKLLKFFVLFLFLVIKKMEHY